ncbi:hypothetical protein GCM10010420_33860 [Streptomyces glaucosporus]|uniref:STAS domain-containing protein n=1 Tax=Streptomyces glaucosporus TaxID=284044 RepID=A0ABP5VKD3_9ACTN
MAVHEEPQTSGRGEPCPASRPGAGRPIPEPAAPVLAVDGPITRADIPALCERLHRLLRGTRADPVTVDMGGCPTADLVAVDALARLQLTARRLGRRIRLGRAGGDLRSLLARTGLDEALDRETDGETNGGAGGETDRGAAEEARGAGPDRAGSAGTEARGQAEQREQPGGVQEGVDPGDPPL